MQATIPVERMRGINGPDDSPTLNAVVVYDGLRAGQRAVSALTALTAELEGERVALRPQLWRFDLLEDLDWFALALADAVNADMLVLSTSRASGLPATVEGWLNLCLTRKRGTSAAVIALLGPDRNLDGPASPRLQFVQSAANGAGLDFFAPGLPSQRALD